MRSLLKENWIILGLYTALVLLISFYLFRYSKVEIHLYLNQLVGNKYIDGFFYYVTYLGDGVVAPVLLLIVLFYNARLGICCTVAFLLAALVAWFMKTYLFDDVMRPLHVFQWQVKVPLKFVDADSVHTHRSFPSGHASQAFAIFICLSLFARHHLNKLLFVFIAILVAFSRVYLSQHWLVDITAGSVVGAATGMILYYQLVVKNRLEKLNKPLLKLRAS